MNIRLFIVNLHWETKTLLEVLFLFAITLILNIFVLYPFFTWFIFKILNYTFGLSFAFSYPDYLGLGFIWFLLVATLSPNS